MAGALSGTQEVRRRMGRYGLSARIVYGTGLFLTISPSERHGCLAIRLSRYRDGDPVFHTDTALAERKWIGVETPSLETHAKADGEEVDLLMPEYDG
jgi:hypothetical protein